MDEKEARIHEMETRVRELELDNVKLINTGTERLRALNDMKLEKDQLMNELQDSQSELAGLAGRDPPLSSAQIAGVKNRILSCLLNPNRAAGRAAGSLPQGMVRLLRSEVTGWGSGTEWWEYNL